MTEHPHGTLGVGALATLVGSAVLAGCGRTPVDAPRNVVLVCIDTLRADHLGCYGYSERETTPRLDRLADESVLFVDACATACWTKPSVPSILTGLYPIQHGVYRGSSKDGDGVHSDVLPERAWTLAEAFAERGYATAAFVKNAQLRKGLGFEQGFELYDDQAGDAREIRWKASDWLDARDGERPFFLYLHLLDAHWPYPVPDEYLARFAGAEAVKRFRSLDWRDLRDAYNDGREDAVAPTRDELIGMYDGAIRYVDDQLGRLIDELERDGLREETVVCIVSDHGEEFLEHGRLGHGHGLWENLLHVPWILHVPGLAPRRVESPVSLVDLFPTLVSAAGLEAPRNLPGVDRLGDSAETELFAEHLEPSSYSRSLRRGPTKIVEVQEASGDAALSQTFPGRWRAAVEARPDGTLYATRLRPGDGEDEEDPVEIKGPLERLSGDSFEVNGVAVRVGRDCELYGETRGPDGAARSLVEGSMVKVKGRLVEGVFDAERIKLYAPDDGVERELRGPLSGSVRSGSLVLGGFRLLVDEGTRVEGASSDLRRTSVLPVEASVRRIDVRAYDLASDPRELEPAAGEAAALDLFERLDALQRALAEERIWNEDDREVLTDSEIEALRAIGYAE